MLNSVRFFYRLTMASLLFGINSACADIALLIHGFDSHAGTWQYSGINAYLQQQGWQFYGVLNDQGQAIVLRPGGLNSAEQTSKHDRKLYTVNLASRAPIAYQSYQLARMLQWLNRVHPGESIYLVGHSAGGLVARYTLVRLYQQQNFHRPGQVAGLLTIATPHLGTFRAMQAIDAIDEPAFCPGPGWRFLQSVFADDEYDVLRKSQDLLHELFPAQTNNLLLWLNRQVHPDIAYFSVVRTNGFIQGDLLVPGYSQDMNNVPALHRQSVTLNSHNGHFLTPKDALTIHSVLMSLTLEQTKS